MTRAFDKIRAGLDEALTRMTKVTPSCGCVWCDLTLPVWCDDHGFYHDGPENSRISCEAPLEYTR